MEDDGDVQLFRRAMRSLGVEPLAPDGETADGEAADTADAAPDPAALAALRAAAVAGDEERPTPPASRRRRRRGALRVDDRLDLHHATADEALLRLAGFLVGARRRGAAAVLVVTGRGRHSAGGVAVLRGRVEAWLGREGRTLVAGWEEAPPRLGGAGALVVRLRGRR